MKFTAAAIAAVVGLASAQSAIPRASGAVEIVDKPISISGRNNDYKNREISRNMTCDDKRDQGSDLAVFVLAPNAALSNVIIHKDAVEGIHCKGPCTLTNVWFRDVCEDAITLMGSGPYEIVGGGAQDAVDKVIQHNGVGKVTIRNFTVQNSGKLYRSCGNCSGNTGKKRDVELVGVRAFGMTSDLVGINSNYGDTATVDATTCGRTKNVCQQYQGVDKLVTKGDGPKVNGKENCLGPRGKVETLPAC